MCPAQEHGGGAGDPGGEEEDDADPPGGPARHGRQVKPQQEGDR